MTQKPYSVSIGILVVTSAVVIMTSRGIAANLVSRPIMSADPQAILKTATKAVRKSGSLKPIFPNRPAPTN
jgi:hypothetical protein